MASNYKGRNNSPYNDRNNDRDREDRYNHSERSSYRRGRDRSHDRFSKRSRSRSHSHEYSRRKYPEKRSRSRSPERYAERKSRDYSPERKKDEKRSVKLLTSQINKIQNEKMAIVKKLTSANEGDSDDEEGVIRNGNSGISTETVYVNSNEAVDDEDIMRIMGFAGFDTTKNKPVEDNHHGAALGTVSKHKKRVYRQYMNRKGGFNRPLQKLD